ncbi:MAG: HRDC domain-containing protein [Candidatus Amulumruptor caecigallinarius]|nr:HRDC domain-containing protein [Candidatus Amulumruptor caecigallinarius]
MWRRNLSKELNVPAFTILSTKTLLAVSNYLPVSYDELALMPGIGKVKIRDFGDNLLDIVAEHIATTPADKVMKLPVPARKRKHRHV